MGITFKAIMRDKWNLVSTIFYLICGWTVAVDFAGIKAGLPEAGFYWLVAGGVLYSGGAFFYLFDKLPRNHEIWHFFILGAAACHWISIFFYVI